MVSAKRRWSIKPRPVHERFWEKVDASGDCWEWTASQRGRGYGQFAWGAHHPEFPGKIEEAHRVSWQLLVGPIPEGLVIDHLCENRLCVNPDHLMPTTQGHNSMRSGRSPAAIAAARTHCVNGHPFAGDNVRINSEGKRRCRTCERAANRRAYHKRRRMQHG